ncbi:MAG: hypothetical protein ACJ72N_22435 [Labedaea sp.]
MTNSVQEHQRQSELMAESSGSVPYAIPPHAPLVSGGWYRGMSMVEVLGPGRYPVDVPGDKSVGLALALTLIFGPAGVCYVSVAGGLICLALTVVAVFLIGPAPLLVAWPLAMVCAGVIAGGMHAARQRQ